MATQLQFDVQQLQPTTECNHIPQISQYLLFLSTSGLGCSTQISIASVLASDLGPSKNIKQVTDVLLDTDLDREFLITCCFTTFIDFIKLYS